jgi:hypothetical protein
MTAYIAQGKDSRPHHAKSVGALRDDRMDAVKKHFPLFVISDVAQFG